jgi:haloacid dehalogenase-like hydrolase
MAYKRKNQEKQIMKLIPQRTWFPSLCLLGLLACSYASAQDPLPSWNDGPNRQAITQFVADVTRQGSSTFVPQDQRIATFDNDGTLWVEQPMYTQLAFALARVKALAPQHPDWKQQQPFEAVLDNDMKSVVASGERGLVQLIVATHTGMTTADFETIVENWFRTARHPRFHQPYTACVYQPMLELLAYLRANGFKTYIVSGGGVEFMRPWVEGVYGVPPEQTVGSTIKTQFEMKNGIPVLMRLPDVDFVDDKAGKPVGINKFIGRRPIAAFGNSDGDQQMLEWTAAGTGKRLMLLVHHTDATREYAYDRQSAFGKLDKALDEAKARSWVVVDMKRDWKTIFPASAEVQ